MYSLPDLCDELAPTAVEYWPVFPLALYALEMRHGTVKVVDNFPVDMTVNNEDSPNHL